jgi:hypothetical protein
MSSLNGENMKLSKSTVEILKNYANINGNLLLKAGTKLGTISEQKNIMASTSVAETFPSEFGIYDLNEFLSAMSIFEDPELEFSEKFVTIKQGANQIKYYAAEATNLTVPQKEIVFPEAEINFKITAGQLDLIRKTSGVLSAPDLSIVGDGSKITAQVGQKKNATANSYDVDLGATDKSFKVNLKVENLKMLPGEYNVSISSKRISRFQGTSDLVYYVAVEADSAFDF